MNPVQFGQKGTTLTGIYHSPRAAVARDASVLICSPIGQEYMRTHWTIRQLAIRLAEAGIHVLRFDYLGTGDSDGDMGDSTVEVWAENVQLALSELYELSGVREPTMVGVRLGAMISAVAGARGPIHAPRLVFWDPVVHGSEYLANLTQIHAYIVQVARLFPPISSDELVGFRYPHQLRREIEALDLTGLLAGLGSVQVDVLTTESRPEYARLLGVLENLQIKGDRVHVADPGTWDVPEKARIAMLADKTVKAVSSLVGGLAGDGAP